MGDCPCIVEDMKREDQLDATQWFIELMFRSTNRGADKSLARPERKQATATDEFEFHIYYL